MFVAVEDAPVIASRLLMERWMIEKGEPSLARIVESCVVSQCLSVAFGWRRDVSRKGQQRGLIEG